MVCLNHLILLQLTPETPYLQIESHSEILGVRGSAYELGRRGNTIQPVTAPHVLENRSAHQIGAQLISCLGALSGHSSWGRCRHTGAAIRPSLPPDPHECLLLRTTGHRPTPPRGHIYTAGQGLPGEMPHRAVANQVSRSPYCSHLCFSKDRMQSVPSWHGLPNLGS